MKHIGWRHNYNNLNVYAYADQRRGDLAVVAQGGVDRQACTRAVGSLNLTPFSFIMENHYRVV